MQEFYQSVKDLQPPTNNAISTTIQTQEKRDYLQYICRLCGYMQNRFQEIQDFLDDTETVLGTTIYKNHNRFRNDKAFKGLKMIQKSLERLKNLKLHSTLRRFSELMPLMVDLKDSYSSPYIPSLSILQHLLCIHIGTFLQAQRLLGLCEHSSKYLLARIRLGHFWSWALFSIANVSRLWTLSQSMLVYLHLSYEALKKLENVLSKSETDWLPKNLNLPALLIQMESELRTKEVVQKLLENNDFPVFDKKEVVDKEKFAMIGEEIQRDEKKEVTQLQFAKVKKITLQMKTLEDFRAFLKDETQARKISRKTAITKRLDQNTWKTLKSALKLKLDEKDSLKTLRQFLLSWILFPEFLGDQKPLERFRNK